MKIGDVVRDKVTHERYLLGYRTGSVWDIRALGEKAFIGSIHESRIELIEEEPMHPRDYLTPEWIERVATVAAEDYFGPPVAGRHVDELKNSIAKALEREANPPPKARVFRVTIPGLDHKFDATDIRDCINRDGVLRVAVTVEEVPA